jgi:hypothetical protein
MATAPKSSLKPAILSRRNSVHVHAHLWERTMQRLVKGGDTRGMPTYVDMLLTALVELDAEQARLALVRGDVAFFIAVELRLLKLDEAFVAAGRTIADRAKLIQAKAVVAGLKDVAIENLRERGGAWP